MKRLSILAIALLAAINLASCASMVSGYLYGKHKESEQRASKQG